MRVNDFIAGLPLQYNDWGTPTCTPKDSLFASSIKGVWGMIVPNKMQLIRYACSCLEPNEIYLEAGVLQGMSMICATRGNNVTAVGVDNWSQFPSTEGNAIACRRALRESEVESRVTLIEDDIKKVLVSRTFPRVGVYHYDACHDYVETLFGLEFALPHLSDDAVIIVDDSAWDGPRGAISLVLNRYGRVTSEHGAVEMLFDMKGEDYQGVWTTGMCAMHYRRF